MAASFPVVLASDQSSLPVTGTFFQATQPISGTVTANLSTTDNNVLDALELVNTVKDVEWLSAETISDQSLSSVLDTEGYMGVYIYGENDGTISNGNFKIFGSNTSGGTYYNMGGALDVSTQDSGRFLLSDTSPTGNMMNARYLKLFNASGSSKTVLKLRAVLSKKMRYL